MLLEPRPSGDGSDRLQRLRAALTIMVMNAKLVTMIRKEKVVPAGEFKAKCLAILDEVEVRSRSFVVTKRGRPVARVVPLSAKEPSSLRGSLLHEEDLLAPVGVDWDAQS